MQQVLQTGLYLKQPRHQLNSRMTLDGLPHSPPLDEPNDHLRRPHLVKYIRYEPCPDDIAPPVGLDHGCTVVQVRFHHHVLIRQYLVRSHFQCQAGAGEEVAFTFAEQVPGQVTDLFAGDETVGLTSEAFLESCAECPESTLYRERSLHHALLPLTGFISRNSLKL